MDKINKSTFISRIVDHVKGYRISYYNPKGSQAAELEFLMATARKWKGTLYKFGFVGGAAFIYLTDWTVVADKIPFYNQKFKGSSE